MSPNRIMASHSYRRYDKVLTRIGGNLLSVTGNL